MSDAGSPPAPALTRADSNASSSAHSEDGPSAAELATSALLDSVYAADAAEALGALVKIAADPACAPDMLAAGAAGAVVLTMRTFPTPSVQYRALSALRAFSVAPALRSEVLREGGLELTLALMAADPALTVQDRGATIVANLSVGCPHRKRRLAREGAVAAVVRAMASFPDDVQMQVRGALALRNLSHNAQVNQYIAGKAGAVDVVLDALMNPNAANDKDLVYQSIAALESMCTQDKKNRQRIVHRDMPSWPKHLWDESLSGLNCDPPTKDRNLSPVSSNSDENQKMLLSPTDNGNDPASSTTGHSLRKKAKNKNDALDMAATVDSLGDPPSPRKSIQGMDTSLADKAKLDAITDGSASVDGNSSASQHSKVDTHTDGTLSLDRQTALFPLSVPAEAESVFRIMLRAVRKSPENRSLLKYTLSLLGLTSCKQPKVQMRLGDLGAVEVALATVKRYEVDVPLVTRACTLICTLCLQDENRERVHSGLGVLLRALESNMDNLAAAREITSAISNALYNSPKNRASVMKREGGRTVADMLISNNGRDLRSLEAGLCTLRNLVDGQREGASQCASENAIGAARAALDATKDVKTDEENRVQVQAILLLGDIAKSAPETTTEMRSLEVGDWVENALAKLDKVAHQEAHLVGDELILSLQERIDFSRGINEDDLHSFSFSSRWAQTKEIFQSISVPFAPNKRSTEPGRRKRRRRRRWARRGERRSSREARDSKAEVFFGRKWPWSS